MMDKLDVLIAKVEQVSNKLDMLLNAIAEDEPEQHTFDLDGNKMNADRDTNQEL